MKSLFVQETIDIEAVERGQVWRKLAINQRCCAVEIFLNRVKLKTEGHSPYCSPSSLWKLVRNYHAPWRKHRHQFTICKFEWTNNVRVGSYSSVTRLFWVGRSKLETYLPSHERRMRSKYFICFPWVVCLSVQPERS